MLRNDRNVLHVVMMVDIDGGPHCSASLDICLHVELMLWIL